MYIIRLKQIIEHNCTLYKRFYSDLSILFKQEAIFSIILLQNSLKILENYEKEASSYLLYSKTSYLSKPPKDLSVALPSPFSK